ncbi:MAG: TIGR03936 family radical SAM-associated protein [Planctomycetota bacterium]|jgi:radical SAM-linked protein
MNKTLVIKFKIKGDLKFLSHHETMAMFQRIFTRAGIKLHYSAGFNPRPRFSLPLPRSVGTESDAECVCALVGGDFCLDCRQVKGLLCRYVPQGCEITSVELMDGKVSYQPVSVVYEFSLAPSAGVKDIDSAVEGLQRALAAGVELFVLRCRHKASSPQNKDVSKYIDSIGREQNKFTVKCNITGSGTVKIDEILQLLQIDSSRAWGSVKRKHVQWRNN